MSTENVYQAFLEEVEHMVVAAGDPAVRVLGDVTRAVKRAQMVIDGEIRPVRERLGLPPVSGGTGGDNQ